MSRYNEYGYNGFNAQFSFDKRYTEGRRTVDHPGSKYLPDILKYAQKTAKARGSPFYLIFARNAWYTAGKREFDGHTGRKYFISAEGNVIEYEKERVS